MRVDDASIAGIGQGLLALVGVGADDQHADADWLAEKIVALRVFPDGDGLMSRALLDVRGQLLAVSQFTLLGDCRKGRRPSFSAAMAPGPAEALFARFVERARHLGAAVQTGQFGATMEVELVNDGPVTLVIDSKRTL